MRQAHRRRDLMNHQPLTTIEREVASWPGVSPRPTTPPQTRSRKKRLGEGWASSLGPSSSVVGAALIGAFLAAREESGSAATNPLHTLDAAPFSYAFLAIVQALILALIAASGHGASRS
jgi:hypothetical protein